MKKDILIPKVTNVFLAAVKEYNDVFKCDDWNVYLINNKDIDLETVLIVSKGIDKNSQSETSLLRHKIEKLPAKSYAKVEFLQEDVLKLTNFFNVTFFEENTLFDKKFIFEKESVKTSALRMIPFLKKRGVLAK